jgi:hypothetical protein
VKGGRLIRFVMAVLAPFLRHVLCDYEATVPWFLEPSGNPRVSHQTVGTPRVVGRLTSRNKLGETCLGEHDHRRI